MVQGNEVEERLAKVEKGLLAVKEQLDKQDYIGLAKAVEELTELVEGNPRLRAKPLRDMVDEMWEERARIKWFFATLGVTTVSSIIALIVTLLKLFAK